MSTPVASRSPSPRPSFRGHGAGRPGAGRDFFYAWAIPASIGLGLISMLVMPQVSSLGYDAWSWADWGRELAHGFFIDTVNASSSIKPLPVYICALLVPFGNNQPWAWLVIARAGMFLAALLAFRLGCRLSAGKWMAGLFAVGGVVTITELLGYIFISSYSDALEVCLALWALDLLRSGRRVGTGVVLFVASLSRIEMTSFFAIYMAWCVWRYPHKARSAAAGMIGIAFVAFSWFGIDYLSSGNLFRSALQAQHGNRGRPIFQPQPFVVVSEEALYGVLLPVTVAFAAEIVRDLVVLVVRRQARFTLIPALAALCWAAGEGLMAQLHLATGSAIYLSTGLGLEAVVGGVLFGDVMAWGWAQRRSGRAVLAGLAVVAVVLGVTSASARWTETGPVWWNTEVSSYRGALPVAAQDAQVEQAIKVAGGRSKVLGCGRIVEASSLANPVVAWALQIPLGHVSNDVKAAAGAVFISPPPVPPAPQVGRGVGAWSIVEHCVPGPGAG
ncbi:MAG TPA: hypothetical protein VKV06_05975 [Acidimicrobiales bacterium]|nr:hypothetical protein [Acidimicrobiales bacterium]